MEKDKKIRVAVKHIKDTTSEERLGKALDMLFSESDLLEEMERISHSEKEQNGPEIFI